MRNNRTIAVVLAAATSVIFSCSADSGTGSSPVGSGKGGAGGGIIGQGGGQAGGMPNLDASLGDSGLEGCASDSYTGELVPVGMYLLLDHSGSMSSPLDADAGAGPSKWDQVTEAIKQFMALPGTTGISMGLGYFPVPPAVQPPVACQTKADCYPYSDMCFMQKCMDVIGGVDESCIPSDYQKVSVEIAPLPGVAGEVGASIDATSPTGNTPMTPAMRGTMDYMLEWAGQHTDHIAMVVLATDGMPTGCVDNEPENVAAIAEEGYGSSIMTFVIGIGGQLSDLNQIAQKGGTDKAFIIGSGDVGAEFLSALNAIRGAVGCTYKIPMPPTGDPDPNLVNVAFTPEGGTQEVYPRVASAADCKGDKGWYYDNPSDPHQIILCPAACDQVETVKGKVDVVLGCPTQLK